MTLTALKIESKALFDELLALRQKYQWTGKLVPFTDGHPARAREIEIVKRSYEITEERRALGEVLPHDHPDQRRDHRRR